jgi:hypothetical protein
MILEEDEHIQQLLAVSIVLAVVLINFKMFVKVEVARFRQLAASVTG